MADKTNPPYISHKVLKSFFDKMRNVKKPSELSTSVLREYGLNASAAALQSALKFLGFIGEDGKTTDVFNRIQVDGEQFKKNLKEIVTTSYKDLFDKHHLDHSSYEEIVNYFKQKYSPASAKKMAKSFAVLCQYAGIESAAFSKMRSLSKTSQKSTVKPKKNERHEDVSEEATPRQVNKNYSHSEPPSSKEGLVADFIKTNPIPQGVQWDSDTLKTYFSQYQATIKMLRGET